MLRAGGKFAITIVLFKWASYLWLYGLYSTFTKIAKTYVLGKRFELVLVHILRKNTKNLIKSKRLFSNQFLYLQTRLSFRFVLETPFLTLVPLSSPNKSVGLKIRIDYEFSYYSRVNFCCAVIVIQSTILCSSIRHHDSKKWQIFMKPKLRWYWSWVDFVNSQGYYTVSLLLYRGLVSNAFHMPSIKEND